MCEKVSGFKFTHFSIQQILVEQLLCASIVLNSGGTAVNKIDKNPFFILMGKEKTNNTYNK